MLGSNIATGRESSGGVLRGLVEEFRKECASLREEASRLDVMALPYPPAEENKSLSVSPALPEWHERIASLIREARVDIEAVRSAIRRAEI